MYWYSYKKVSFLQVHDFELSSDDMVLLNKLDQGSDGRIFDFGFFKG
jgi:hypothetical protein